MSDVRIRRARRSDAAVIARFANDLNRLEACATTPFTKASVLRDGFGRNRAFTALVATLNRRVVGCLIYLNGYDTDKARPCYWVEIIYVSPTARGRSIGHKLMGTLAAQVLREGRPSICWGVRANNKQAAKFYAGLDAEPEHAGIFGVSGAALRQLAKASG